MPSKTKNIGTPSYRSTRHLAYGRLLHPGTTPPHSLELCVLHHVLLLGRYFTKQETDGATHTSLVPLTGFHSDPSPHHLMTPMNFSISSSTFLSPALFLTPPHTPHDPLHPLSCPFRCSLHIAPEIPLPPAPSILAFCCCHCCVDATSPLPLPVPARYAQLCLSILKYVYIYPPGTPPPPRAYPRFSSPVPNSRSSGHSSIYIDLTDHDYFRQIAGAYVGISLVFYCCITLSKDNVQHHEVQCLQVYISLTNIPRRK